MPKKQIKILRKMLNIYCIKCLKKTDIEYQVLSKSDSMWFCGPCRGKVEKNIVTDVKNKNRREM
jgi:hypothetical protein